MTYIHYNYTTLLSILICEVKDLHISSIRMICTFLAKLIVDVLQANNDVSCHAYQQCN